MQRNIIIGLVSVLLLSAVTILDVKMQTASADQINPLSLVPVSDMLTEVINSADTDSAATSTPVTESAGSATTTEPALPSANSAASSQIQHTYATVGRNPGNPLRLVIPSIGLDTTIEHMGLNSKGEMDVPAGTTHNVGWYQKGTVPGKTGSAVIAAHVFAAFKNLDSLAVGSDVFVITDKNERLHFIVRDSKEYALADVSAQQLFNRKDARRLNLITCAGQFIPSMDTYNRRLIVYTTLVG